ncbi:SulP family inorganic anion transporter [Candidatus Nitrotoga sp. 1052]|uniref:SulP family inorganic anion transporter n=1 Tax=Candidatus Nitrotoga sp. 1052 TaxID=2886964 RepID=UPI001EF64B24|nr:sulfate permease [Candidatus Nitrotoga sp. 1052]CAH1080661.1 putative sulfate transporter YvdB [Candidatus Nitrotoga sp. 1052]
MKLAEFFRPKLLDTLRGYNRQLFVSDLTAGITVGIVALPLAIAFAIASGVKPEAGIFTAIIAGFIISALGGSRVQIGGPTGAFIVIVYGIVMQYGLANLLICTIMSGIMLLLMGLFKLGSLIKLIPHPLVIGFTNGIAVLIMLSEVKDFLGLKMDSVPAEFSHKLNALYQALPSFDLTSIALATLSMLLILFYPKNWARHMPSLIVALVLGTVIVALIDLPVETISTRFGGIPQGLPAFEMPEFTFATVRYLFSPALTIALLGAIESLLSATVADGMIDDKHDPNQELVAQGFANIVCPFFGGIPATGAIARTATSVRAGANSPVAGMVHAITLLLIILIAAPLAKHIPLATLAAILMVVAINMGEWEAFTRLKKYPASDSAVMLTSFVLTVVFDITVAVEIGMVLAVLFFIHRITGLTHVSVAQESLDHDDSETTLARKVVPKGVMIYRIFGALFFGAADKLETILRQQQNEPDVLILKMDEVISMDASALHTLASMQRKLRKNGKYLILCGAHTQPYFMMHQAGFFDEMGSDNVTADLDSALRRAAKLLEEKKLAQV